MQVNTEKKLSEYYKMLILSELHETFKIINFMILKLQGKKCSSDFVSKITCVTQTFFAWGHQGNKCTEECFPIYLSAYYITSKRNECLICFLFYIQKNQWIQLNYSFIS